MKPYQISELAQHMSKTSIEKSKIKSAHCDLDGPFAVPLKGRSSANL